MLRVPRNGGVARVSAYPNLDSTVWTGTDTVPPLQRVLGFDADAGLVAAVDSRERPLWLDLRVGSVNLGSKKPVGSLVSVDGSNIFGIGPDGAVARFAPSGNWVRPLPRPARAVFPQIVGTLVVLGGRGADARLWRLRPPDPAITDSIEVPGATSGIGAPLGDRIYVASGNQAVFDVSARTLAKGAPVRLDHPIRAIAASPSGDRVYVLTQSSHALEVLSGFSNRVTARIELPADGRDVRVDPFGRYVLVAAATGNSLWIISVGTDQIVTTMRSSWRADLPFVAPDGAVAILNGTDVSFIDPLSPKETRHVAGGADDFWYPFVWHGFRPRAAALDQPANFPRDSDTTVAPPVKAETLAAPPHVRADSARIGFTVSFAVLLDAAKAQAQATKIVVDGRSARVVTGVTDGTAVYRVVLGPYPTRDQAERVGQASGQNYYIYAGSP
ncbi:MAG: SPOR domain-containing protein [Gemmatimonadaceae bacterium]